jgi:hypothetical protein
MPDHRRLLPPRHAAAVGGVCDRGLLPLVSATGWASSVPAHAVILLMGLLGRPHWMPDVPPRPEHADAPVAVGAMCARRFCADKIPYLDSVWDALHTVVRPVPAGCVGALIGHDSAQLLGPNATTMPMALGAAVAGGAAPACHLVKGSIRPAVDTSPEPVGNLLVSRAEDLAAVGVLVLTAAHRGPARRSTRACSRWAR